MRNFRILKLTFGSKRAYWMISAVRAVKPMGSSHKNYTGSPENESEVLGYNV